MKNYAINLEEIKKRYANNKIKLLRESGMYLEVAEERHVRLVMPLGDLHINHIGTAYAGSIYMIGEAITAAIIYSNYGTDSYVPIISKSEIEFLKPASKDLVVDFPMTEEEAATLIAPVEERGKGRVNLSYFITDIEGTEIAKITHVVYLMPIPQK